MSLTAVSASVDDIQEQPNSTPMLTGVAIRL